MKPRDIFARALHSARHKPKLAPRLFRAKRARGQRKLAQQQCVPPDEFRYLHQRARFRRQPHIHLHDAERRVRRGSAHVNSAEQVERQHVCYAVHGRYTGWGCASVPQSRFGRRGGRELGGRDGMVRVLWERMQGLILWLVVVVVLSMSRILLVCGGKGAEEDRF